MRNYSEAAVERAMKVQEVILRAAAKRITWIQAAEILGVTPRHMRRWKEKYEQFGFRALFDGRRGKASPRRVPSTTLEEVLRLYLERYFDLNVKHFHEKITGEHGFAVSYTWTKGVLQGADLVRHAPQAPAAPPADGDAAAHRRQPAPVVRRRALARPHSPPRRRHLLDLLRAVSRGVCRRS
jgi:transposase